MPHAGLCVFVGNNLHVHAMLQNLGNEEIHLNTSHKGSRKILTLSKDLTVYNFIQY